MKSSSITKPTNLEKKRRSGTVVEKRKLLSVVEFHTLWLTPRTTDTQRDNFFKIPSIWVWAEKFGQNFLGHFWYFRPNYSTHFSTVSPLFMALSTWLLVFWPKTYNSQITLDFEQILLCFVANPNQ